MFEKLLVFNLLPNYGGGWMELACKVTKIKKSCAIIGSPAFCDSGGIQTHNLLIRSQMLYSVELRSLS